MGEAGNWTSAAAAVVLALTCAAVRVAAGADRPGDYGAGSGKASRPAADAALKADLLQVQGKWEREVPVNSPLPYRRAVKDIKGSEDWQTIELWVKTEKWQDRITLALRLGGYSSLNTGEAWFSDIKAEAVSGPPSNAKNVYQPATGGGGFAPLSLWALILLLGLLTAALW